MCEKERLEAARDLFSDLLGRRNFVPSLDISHVHAEWKNDVFVVEVGIKHKGISKHSAGPMGLKGFLTLCPPDDD